MNVILNYVGRNSRRAAIVKGTLLDDTEKMKESSSNAYSTRREWEVRALVVG